MKQIHILLTIKDGEREELEKAYYDLRLKCLQKRTSMSAWCKAKILKELAAGPNHHPLE